MPMITMERCMSMSTFTMQIITSIRISAAIATEKIF